MRLTILCLIIIALLACQKQEPKHEPTQKTLPSFVLNTDGDTFPTGVWLPIEFQLLDTDSLEAPKPERLPSKTKAISLTPKAHPVPAPTITYLTQPPKVLIPGENGIPLPISNKIRGRIIPAKYPQPVPASSPLLKDRAIADIRELGVAQGMRYGIVGTLMRDMNNYLWMGTNAGISRYDGKNFLHFEQRHGMPLFFMRDMLQDRRGTIWMTSAFSGVSTFDGNAFVHFSEEGGLPSNRIYNHKYSIGEDAQGNIWIRQKWLNDQEWLNDVVRLSPGEKKEEGTITRFNVDNALFDQTISTLFVDNRGYLWLGAEQGFYLFKPGLEGEVERFFYVKCGTPMRPISQDQSGAIWFSRPEGNHRLSLNLETWEERFFSRTSAATQADTIGILETYSLPSGESSQVLETGPHDFWFLSREDGLFQYQANKQAYTHFSLEEGLTNRRVEDGLLDEYKTLWLGTFGGGINAYFPGGFRHYNIEQGLMSDRVTTITEDKKGYLWFGTEGSHLLHQYDPEKDAFTYWELAEEMYIVAKLFTGPSGRLWGQNRIQPLGYQIDPQTSTMTPMQNPYRGGRGGIQVLREDQSGGLWTNMATNTGWQFCYYLPQADQNPLIYASTSSLGERFVLLEDSQGDFWLASETIGISRLRLDDQGLASPAYLKGHIRHYGKPVGWQASSLIYMMIEDRYGDIWIARRDGLYRLRKVEEDAVAFKRYGVKDGLSFHDVRSLQEDQHGNIWIGTYKGLSILVRDTTSADPRNVFRFGSFTQEDGLKDLSFVQRSIFLDRRNTLWMGTFQGLISLDLNTFQFPSSPPKNVKLTHISIDQTYIDYRQLSDATYRQQFSFGEALYQGMDSVAPFQNYPLNLRLPYDLHHLSFHFSAIDWYAPHRIQYQFFMEGVDNKWREPQSSPQVEYRNLSHGTYTLRAKATGAAQLESEEFTYTFSIRPPWWLSWWAYTIYVLAAVVALYLIFQWRTISLRKQRQLLRTRVFEQTQEIRAEQERANELLLNILPAKVAQELKETGSAQPVFFEEVSILFADFKGFTNIVASIPGKKLIAELDDIFQHYDDIIQAVGIEKIQTIGDAYLAACGVPTPDPDHAIKCVEAGKRIIAYLNERNKTSDIKWEVRLGIHSGPISAGVIGKKKFSYDLFGDSINIAARIESAGEAGKINVSAYTHSLIKHRYPGTYRGKIKAKGKGELDMYFVE